MAKTTHNEGLSDAELMALPVANLSPAMLLRLWDVHARVNQGKAEETMDMTIRHRRAEQKMEQDKQEDKRGEIALQEYRQMMRDVEWRSDELLEKIEREEQRVEKRHQEIEGHAIRLHDGRRAYIDGANYRDEEGRALTGSDHDEAAKAHRENPSSSTWQDKRQAEEKIAALAELKKHVQDLHNETHDDLRSEVNPEQAEQRAKRNGALIEEYEKEYRDEVESKSAAPGNYGNVDYVSAYGRNTSVASAIDGRSAKPLSATFAPKAAGESTNKVASTPTTTLVPYAPN